MNGEMKVTALDMAQTALANAIAERDDALGKIAVLEADLKGCRQSRGTAKDRVAILEGDRARDKAEIVKLDRDVAIARDQRDHAEKERDAATSNRLREALAMVDALNAQNKELQADSVKLQVAEQDVARMRVERESEMDAARRDSLNLDAAYKRIRELEAQAEIAAAAWRADDTKWRAEERKLRDELARINPYATAWLAYERIDLTISDVIEWKLERDYHVAHDQLDAWFAKLQRLQAIAKSAREAWGEAEEAAQAAWFKDDLVAKR